MRIRKMVIQNFRVFRGVYEFDFSDKELIILAGANGHGKSSVFDAIQWCLIGELQRYRGTNEYQNFNFLINNNELLSFPVIMKVELWLSSASDVEDTLQISRTIRRTQRASNETVHINGQEFRKKEGTNKIREFLMKEFDEANNDMQLDFSRFFTTSQLLSQDQLHAFIHGTNPKERFRVMENLLGLKKYGVHFRKYLNESIDVISSENHILEKELNIKREQLIEVSTRLKAQSEISNKSGDYTEDELLIKINSSILDVKYYFYWVSTIDKLHEDSQADLIKIRKSIMDKKMLYESRIIKLNDSKAFLSLQPSDYDIKSRSLGLSSKELETKIKLRTDSVEKSVLRLMSLRTVRDRRSSYISTKQRIIDITSELGKIEDENRKILQLPMVESLKNKFENWSEFSNLYKSKQTKLAHLRLSKGVYDTEQEIGSNYEICKKLDGGIVDAEVQISLMQNAIDVINQKMSEINRKQLTEQTDRIQQAIYDIQQKLLEEDPNQPCVVCGTIFEPPSTLHKAIHFQLKKMEDQRTEVEQNKIELLSERSRLTSEIHSIMRIKDDLHSKIISVKNEIENKVIQLEKWKAEITTNEFSSEEITNQIISVESFLESYQISFGLLQNYEQNLEVIRSLQEELTFQTSNSNELKRLSGKWKKYLDTSESLLDKKITGLENYQAKAKESVGILEKRFVKIEDDRRRLEKQWAEREQKIQEIRAEVNGFSGGVDELEKEIEQVRSLIMLFGKWERDFGVHIQQFNYFLLKDELRELRKSNELLTHEIEQLNNTKNGLVQMKQSIETVKTQHESIHSDLMAKYLSQYSEVIDHLFLQISPHAIYRHVHLIPRDGNLFIVMSEKSFKVEDLNKLSDEELRTRFNASLTFSSGQASVLAVCIFLALNQSQKWSDLDFLGIDDPFQNMDDVNSFSFIDVLSQYCSSKQILISTHNKEFASLIRAKMGIPDEKIGYLELKSYSRDQVEVDSNCLINNYY